MLSKNCLPFSTFAEVNTSARPRIWARFRICGPYIDVEVFTIGRLEFICLLQQQQKQQIQKQNKTKQKTKQQNQTKQYFCKQRYNSFLYFLFVSRIRRRPEWSDRTLTAFMRGINTSEHDIIAEKETIE